MSSVTVYGRHSPDFFFSDAYSVSSVRFINLTTDKDLRFAHTSISQVFSFQTGSLRFTGLYCYV